LQGREGQQKEDHDQAEAHRQKEALTIYIRLTAGADMTREQAIELARRFAKAKPQSYYSEPFMPHEWVIDAIVAAYLKGCYENNPSGKP
jgi:hypothetical protein